MKKLLKESGMNGIIPIEYNTTKPLGPHASFSSSESKNFIILNKENSIISEK